MTTERSSIPWSGRGWGAERALVEARERALPRVRSVAGIGKLIGAAFALRGAVPLFCVRVLHLEPASGAAAGLAVIPALLLLLCLHSVGAASSVHGGPTRLRLRDRTVTICLAAYLLFAGVSFFWSIADSPASSSVYWVALILDAATVVVLLSLYAPEAVARSLLRGYLAGALAVAALAWMMPAQADLRLGDPDYFNTNQIANICVFGIFAAQYLGRKGMHRTWIPVAALAITLLRTMSKTTLLAFVVSQGILLFRDRNIHRKTRRRILLAAAVVLMVSAGFVSAYYNVYVNTANQAETLTGRTAIWAWTVGEVPDSPWIGHGFDSMWKVMPPFGADRFQARHAENELLQQLYAYGMVGCVLFLAVYFSLFRCFRRCADPTIRPVLKVLLLFILIRGLAEAEPFDLLLPIWLLLLLESIAGDRQSITTDRSDGSPLLHGLRPAAGIPDYVSPS